MIGKHAGKPDLEITVLNSVICTKNNIKFSMIFDRWIMIEGFI